MHILRRLCSLKVYLVMHTVVRSLVMHRVVHSLKKYEYIYLFPPHLGGGGGGGGGAGGEKKSVITIMQCIESQHLLICKLAISISLL